MSACAKCSKDATHLCHECNEKPGQGLFCEYHAGGHNCLVTENRGTVFAVPLKDATVKVREPGR